MNSLQKFHVFHESWNAEEIHCYKIHCVLGHGGNIFAEDYKLLLTGILALISFKVFKSVCNWNLKLITIK